MVCDLPAGGAAPKMLEKAASRCAIGGAPYPASYRAPFGLFWWYSAIPWEFIYLEPANDFNEHRLRRIDRLAAIGQVDALRLSPQAV